MRLWHLIQREVPEHLRTMMLMNVLAAVAMAALLWIVDLASKAAAEGNVSPRLVLMFVIATTLIAVTHNYVLTTSSFDAERMILNMCRRLFDLARRSDLLTVERIGRAALHTVLIQNTQALARILPLLAIGAQQAVMLVFVGGYLAWLSPPAFLIAFGFGGIAVMVRMGRAVSLRRMLRKVGDAESRVFNGLTDLLQGFKEVRMERRRADGVLHELAEASTVARTANSMMKTQWGYDFALIESLFFALIGLMVFVVPLFATGYYEVVVPATTAALFVVGPIATVSYVAPMMTQAEMALASLEEMEQKLRAPALSAAPEVGSEPPSSIALKDAVFAYPGPDDQPVFSVGPLSALFRAGEITFITGGNGSGKSTMLRLLTGLVPLEGGALLVDGIPVATERMQAYRDQISAIFSDHHLSRRLYGLSHVDPARVRRLLEQLEMQDKVSVRNGAFSTVTLSTGQRKRLALVVALLEDKPVMVLDEWAADQDPHFRQVFYETLLPEIRARNRIVICVTHDDRWFDRADRIYHLNEGRIDLTRERQKEEL